MSAIEGKRLLVVGASVSIGETIAREAAAAGAHVAIAARRRPMLERIAGAIGPATVVIEADCTRAEDCERAVAEAVAGLGGLDWLVYTPALFLLRTLDELTPEEWRAVFDLNVIGAALVTRAALPHLAESRGRTAYFTSESTPAHPHWPGLAAYAVSKVALTKLVDCWRWERPEVGFTLVQVGGTEGSDGPNQGGWTPEQVRRFVPQWTNRAPSLQPREVVAAAVLDALASRSYIEHVVVAPPRA